MSVGSKPMMCMEKSGKTVLGQVIGINYHLSSFTHTMVMKNGGDYVSPSFYQWVGKRKLCLRDYLDEHPGNSRLRYSHLPEPEKKQPSPSLGFCLASHWNQTTPLDLLKHSANRNKWPVCRFVRSNKKSLQSKHQPLALVNRFVFSPRGSCLIQTHQQQAETHGPEPRDAARLSLRGRRTCFAGHRRPCRWRKRRGWRDSTESSGELALKPATATFGAAPIERFLRF